VSHTGHLRALSRVPGNWPARFERGGGSGNAVPLTQRLEKGHIRATSLASYSTARPVWRGEGRKVPRGNSLASYPVSRASMALKAFGETPSRLSLATILT